MYHLLPYNVYGVPDAPNGRSNNNHNPNHHLAGEKNLSDAPSNNHGICNNCNSNRLLSYDNINEFYNATTYNLIICKKINTDQILTGDEDNDAPKVLYNSDNNNYDHDTYQDMPGIKDDDTPRQW